MKTLAECAMRVIMVHLDGIDDLGNLPYRLAKPILLLMSAEKLLEIEKTSPHLRDEDQEIWQALCVRRFSIDTDALDFQPPKSWRKLYHTKLIEQKQLEEDAALRLRSKYQALAAEKQDKSLQFRSIGSLPKRARTTGWGRTGPAPPKTLAEKARSETRRKAGMLGVASTSSPHMKVSTASSSTSSAASSISPPLSHFKPTPLKSFPTTANILSTARNSASASSSTSPPISAATPNRSLSERPAIVVQTVMKPATPSTSPSLSNSHSQSRPVASAQSSPPKSSHQPSSPTVPIKRKASLTTFDPSPLESPMYTPTSPIQTTQHGVSPPKHTSPILNSTPYMNKRVGPTSLFMPLPKSQPTTRAR